MRVKTIIFSATVASGLLFMAATAQAETCEERAGNCSAKGGGSQCFYPSIMASCHKTGVYVAPSGTRWPATRDKK